MTKYKDLRHWSGSVGALGYLYVVHCSLMKSAVTLLAVETHISRYSCDVRLGLFGNILSIHFSWIHTRG